MVGPAPSVNIHQSASLASRDVTERARPRATEVRRRAVSGVAVEPPPAPCHQVSGALRCRDVTPARRQQQQVAT